MPRRKKKSSRPAADVPGTLYPTLDLHGLTAAEAEAAASRWLSAQQAAGESTVRIVTGRGLHSQGPAVLPGVVEELLRSLAGSRIERFEKEPGGGVYRIQLVRYRSSRRATPTVSTRDPELLREAEEALLDLGITPTPALLNAEIARIRAKRGDGG